MPIRPPALDDRRFDDLVAELLSRIPAHTPEWTQARVGDPGRTLIELFAWLGDALLYRVNLIPERQRLTFLRLLGQPLRPARPARGLVTLSLKESEPVAAHLIRPPAAFTGPAAFEARSEFTVLPVTGGAYAKRPAPDAPPHVLEALATFHAGGGAVRGYTTTPVFPEDQPAPDGFDVVTDTVDRSLWIALFAPKARPPAPQSSANAAAAAALGQSLTGGRQLLNLGLVPALPSADPLAPIAQRARLPHVWEITANSTGQPVDPDHPWRPEYLALDEVFDSTAGLTQSGVVRLALPRTQVIHAPVNDVRTDPDAGVGDRPPRLDDEVLAARLVAWIRLRPTAPVAPEAADPTQFNTGQGAASRMSSSAGPAAGAATVEHLRLTWAGVNAVEVEQLTTRANLVIGESNGTADQEFATPGESVEPETFLLQVEEDLGPVNWVRMDDLAALDRDAAAARDARVFELDAEAGVVRFGDGVRGRIPPIGRRVMVRQMRSGGGRAGNLPAGSLQAVVATTLGGEVVGGRFKVRQPLAFTGGADAETLAEAERRIPALFRHRERAVTGDDYRTLARETPGVAVGRVELLPRFKPQQRHDDIPGVVTVMALPERPFAPAPNPRADRPFLEGVHAWIEGRRPLGTELYVIGCEYVPVAVSVAVTVREGVGPDTTLQAVKETLRRVLWPLTGGGFDQSGWPLGRALSNRELAVEVARVPGVAEVAGLNLFRRNVASGTWEPVGDSRDGREQNLDLERWQLPELLAVAAIADDTATGAPLSVTGDPNPFADPAAVAVPFVPDLC